MIDIDKVAYTFPQTIQALDRAFNFPNQESRCLRTNHSVQDDKTCFSIYAGHIFDVPTTRSVDGFVVLNDCAAVRATHIKHRMHTPLEWNMALIVTHLEELDKKALSIDLYDNFKKATSNSVELQGSVDITSIIIHHGSQLEDRVISQIIDNLAGIRKENIAGNEAALAISEYACVLEEVDEKGLILPVLFK